VGLAQREIEAAGFSTICLSNIPDLTAAVSVPRIAAIEHPFGQNVGPAGDAATQLAVLRATLEAVEVIETPGKVVHLPFEWPESVESEHPDPPPPIVGYLLKHPLQVVKLIRRQIPET
jgi:D-proline reductase (dithiol) PrdB